MTDSLSPTVPGAGTHDVLVSRRRFAMIVVLLATVLLLASTFACATFGYFTGIAGWPVWQVFPGALALGFIPATILGMVYRHPALRTFYAVSASWLGVLNYCFFAAVACWIVELLSRWLGWNPDYRQMAFIFFGVGGLVAIYGLFQAARIQVTHVTIPLKNLPVYWQGRTLALVTDLHLGLLTGPVFLARVIARLRELSPEAVLVSGDMFDGTRVELDRLVAPWQDFAPRVYYVTGNHEEFSDRGKYLKAVTGTGGRVLHNEKIDLEGLQLIGVHDAEASDPVRLREVLRRVEVDRGKPSILMAHQPDNLAVAEEAGISLQLSGHTHGGQFWPWSWAAARVHGPFVHGLNRLGNLLVYTCSGTGTWGPPLRVGTRSEIVLLRFERA